MLPRLLLVATLASVFVVTVPARGHAQGRHGAPPPVATALTHMADGQPDVQGFWGSDAYTQDLETGLPDEETHEVQGRGPWTRQRRSAGSWIQRMGRSHISPGPRTDGSTFRRSGAASRARAR